VTSECEAKIRGMIEGDQAAMVQLRPRGEIEKGGPS